MLKRFLVFIFGLGATALLLSGLGSRSLLAANGSGPDDALLPVGQTQTVSAGSAQWYKFDVGGKKRPAVATLDAASANGLRLAIYTPDEISAWAQGQGLKAIGVGSPQPDHTLGWSGVLNESGTYYAVAYNDSGAAIDVRVV